MKDEIDDHYGLIEIRPANRWLRMAGRLPRPRMLLGEMWREGELAVLFGEAGSGKSAMAVQIADSLAGGESMAPFETDAKPQRVLYLDLAHSKSQFGMRYGRESGDQDTDGEGLMSHYRFSERFYRVEIKPEHFGKGSGTEPEREVKEMLDSLLRRSRAKAVIIDGLLLLQQMADVRTTARMLEILRSLTREMGISIHAVMPKRRRLVQRPVSLADAHGAVSKYADSVFAIAACPADASLVYVKHLLSRGGEIAFAASHLPAFHLGKGADNFLGLTFRQFADEVCIMHRVLQADRHTVAEVHLLSEEGLSIRKIAARLGLSRSTTHRYLHTEIPPEHGCGVHGQPQIRHAYYFPGREEFEAVSADAKYDDIYLREDAEAYMLRREAFLIDVATANARKAFIETGIAPTFTEACAEIPELWAMIHGETYEPEPEAGLADAPADLPVEPSSQPAEPRDLSPREKLEELGYERSLDRNGREIFVVSRDEQGVADVWYRFDSNGNLHQGTRNSLGCNYRLAGMPVAAEACV